MYKYTLHLDHVCFNYLLNSYNREHHFSIDSDTLLMKIIKGQRLSNADLCLPLTIIYKIKPVAFCLVHFSYKEKISGIGNIWFSNVISSGDANALKIMFAKIFDLASQYGFIRGKVHNIYGPIHNSILIERGCRTFSTPPFSYNMPDNTIALCQLLENIGFHKEKDLIEIIYAYDKRDELLSNIPNKLLNRLSNIEFSLVHSDEILNNQQSYADLYNKAWAKNWGYSPITKDEIGVAARNIENISGMIAKKNNNIIGFTMLQYIEKSGEKFARAFLSGVLPEYRKTGLAIVLTSKLSSMALKNDIKQFSIAWMLEDNKMIIRTMQHMTRYGESTIRNYRIFKATQLNFEGNCNELV